MDVAVLVKAVPSADELDYDATRRTAIRDGVELFLNPFDQRALRVALDLRRAGETVSVVSLGPPPARAALRDAVVLGADRTVLVTDPRLAGSDTLASALALRAALARLRWDLVLAGARTTDSETGQLGPELAELLRLPLLTVARAVGRDSEGPGLTVTVDTGTGWAKYRLRAPALVTVGEKIAKPTKVSEAERAQVPTTAVELLSLEDLALPADRVGLAGSPTVVRAVAEDAPRRAPVVVDGGTPADRVERAIAALEPLLDRDPVAPREWLPLREPRSDPDEVLVLASGADGRLDPAALRAVAEVRAALPGMWPSAVWVGADPPPADTVRLARAGAVAGYLVPLPTLPVDSSTVAEALGLVLDRRPAAAAGVVLADGFGREVAGRLAARRSLGLIGDAISGRVEPPGEILWSKPSFGGRTVAEISSRTRPSLATLRPGFADEPVRDPPATTFDWSVLPDPPASEMLLPVDVGSEISAEGSALIDREVVVAVGMGVGSPEGVDAVRPLAARWGAALGATRRVVDAGWVPPQLQIGLTGRALAPRLGVLLGVAGSANHLVGWRRARTLLAVNRDPAAAIFRDVDVGIVGTVEEIAPRLEAPLAALLGR
ncbi:MAG: FAD-binding protein [Thermoplasmata archaeon]